MTKAASQVNEGCSRPPRSLANAISAGPVRTLAAMSVSGFKVMYPRFTEFAPLHQNVDIADVDSAAVFLCSGISAKTTGQVLFVDAGYNLLTVPEVDEE